MPRPKLSIVIPYYNERDYLPDTLRAVLAQTRAPDQLVVVDNASDDGSPELCRAILEGAPFEVTHLSQPEPGNLPAIRKGLEHVRGDWVVHADADTYYPPHYLARIEELIDSSGPDVNAVMALNLPAPPETDEGRRFRDSRLRLHARHPTRCFTGTCGHTLRMADLRAVGGYSTERWPFVLSDHEIAHQLAKRGRAIYDADLWCMASDRRKDQNATRWTLFERMLYRNVPDRYMDWFFYEYLARRFERRGLTHTKLRRRDWTPSSTA